MTRRILIHTALTSGFLPLARQCLLSHRSEDRSDVGLLVHFVGTAREFQDADRAMQGIQREFGSRLTLTHVDIEKQIHELRLRNRTQFADDELRRGKRIVEQRSVNDGTLSAAEARCAVRWKQLVSVEIRYRTLLASAYDYGRRKGYRYLLHIDSDMVRIGEVGTVLESMGKADAGVIYRPSREEASKVFGTLVAIRIREQRSAFLDRLKQEIDSQDFASQPKGFGQIALLRTYRALSDSTARLSEAIVCSDSVRKGSVYFSGNLGLKRYYRFVFPIVRVSLRLGLPPSLVNGALKVGRVTKQVSRWFR